MKLSKLNMANQRNAKRYRSDDSDSGDENHRLSSTFARFVLIKSTDENKIITKLSPFVIEKQLSSVIGTPTSVKSLKDGSLLVEISTKQQSINLLKQDVFFKVPVKISAHPFLNSSKGVIRCRDLENCETDEIIENLKSQGVTDVKRMQFFRDGVGKPSNTYILTFNQPTVPKDITIGYQIARVDCYVPHPLHCYRCQKF